MFKNLTQIAPSLLILFAAATNTYATELQLRIVGGDNVDISAVPSTVALIDNNTLAQTGSFFQSQFCGGTVIAPRWVLTAAHCFVNQQGVVGKASDTSVLMGSTDLSNPVNQTVGVIEVVVHNGFDSATYTNDIALLRLEYDAIVESTPIDRVAVELNDVAYIAGWGALQQASEDQNQTFPTSLQGAQVPMIPGASCDDLFPIYSGRVTANQVCAGYANGGIDSCQGDSGGPLYRVPSENSGENLTLAGITSWGEGCADPRAPGVYTSTVAYTDWIRQNIGDNSIGTGTVSVSTNNLQSTNDPAGSGTNTPTNNNSLFGNGSGSGGGGASWTILPLLLLSCFGRLVTLSANSSKKRALFVQCQRVFRICCMGLLSACTPLYPLSADEDQVEALSLFNQPIGADRDVVISDTENMWKSRPACTIVKTGFGQNRRAYFLETCTFTNATAQTVCDATPVLANYQFFEGLLVQVAFEFEEIGTKGLFTACVHEQSKARNLTASLSSGTLLVSDLEGAVRDTPVEISIDRSLRTTVSDRSIISQIHLLQ